MTHSPHTVAARPRRGARRWTGPVLAAIAAALIAGCSRSDAKSAAAPAGPVEVAVVTLQPTAVTLTKELPGRTSAFRVAEVRARVNGIVLKRLFTEGADVKEGQPLFAIDPAPYRAALEGARAQLARAEATLASNRMQAQRYTELVADNAVSKQEHESAMAALKASEADVAAGRAAVETAQINLGYTTVTSPVSGRIGRSAVTEGAFVQQSQATLLATVQQLDPVYVDVTQSSVEALRLRRDLADGKLQSAGRGQAKVKLVLEDGREYGVPGALQFTDVTVDAGTGSIALRALFPNPRGELLPGMFVRARLEEGVNPEALLVPQQAVARDQKGLPFALVVTADRKVERRQLVTERAIGDAWLVTGGREARRPGHRGGAAEGPARRRGEARPGRGREAGGALTSTPPQRQPEPIRPGSTRGTVLHRAAHLRVGRRHPGDARGRAVHLRAARLAVPGDRAAADQHVRELPGRVREDARGHRHPGHRAADERARQPALHVVAVGLLRQRAGDPHLRRRDDPDIAQVQVQNKLQLAMPQLPQEVQRQGVRVAKSVSNYLLIIGLVSEDGSMTRNDISDYAYSTMQDPISRVSGVGEVNTFGSAYAMRIWLNPDQLTKYRLTPLDVSTAVQAQNAQISAGQLGGLPAVEGQRLTATITAQTRLQTPEQFRAILLRVSPDGSRVRLGDVARVELAGETSEIETFINGSPSSGIGVRLAAGANALQTASAVRARVDELAKFFPPGLKVVYPVDTTPFVRLSIEEVVKTLLEAVVLVFLVMFLFLQNFRATLIPTIAVPVVLLGTFGVLSAFGFGINTLTMFGLVLAIGLLVDDAIVVVENVERVMSEEGLPPKSATRKSMRQITGALVGIALVLAAVFVPMAFFGGSVGVIYRQFSITIVSSMALSVLVALSLTPALCATILKPVEKGHGLAKKGFFGWFNRAYDRGAGQYQGIVQFLLRRRVRGMIAYAVAGRACSRCCSCGSRPASSRRRTRGSCTSRWSSRRGAPWR